LVVEQLCGFGHRRLFLGCTPDPACRAHGLCCHLGWRTTGTFDRHGDEVLELMTQRVSFSSRGDGT
jgi:hypothetical protein